MKFELFLKSDLSTLRKYRMMFTKRIQIGLVDNLKDPTKIETALRKVLPPEKSPDFCYRLVLHGRAVCKVRKPYCNKCSILHVCRFIKGADE